ncbi:MAG: aldo/keto reductase [Eubacterium ramulus]
MGIGKSKLGARICNIDMTKKKIQFPCLPLAVCVYKENGKINLEKAEAEILEAMKLGVNYFDTAYIYSGSEEAMGKIFEKNHCREQIYIADKLPHYLIKSAAGLEKTFQEQLRRLRTSYIDFYLMHMLTNLGNMGKIKRPWH